MDVSQQPITQASLRLDAQDSLDAYYKEREELIAQIETFKEALESAQDDLKALDKANKNKFKRAGIKQKTKSQIIYDYVKENPGRTFSEIELAVYNLFPDASINHANSLTTIMTRNGSVKMIEGKYYPHNNPSERSNNTGIVNSVINLLVDKGPLSSKEVTLILKPRFPPNYVQNTLGILKRRNKIHSTATHKNDRNAKYYIPKVGQTNESIQDTKASGLFDDRRGNEEDNPRI